LSDCKGVYAGEAGENWRDPQGKQEDSHIFKHWLTGRRDMDTLPRFQMKVVGSFRDALTRWHSEAVRIDLRGGGLLNSKTEYTPVLLLTLRSGRRRRLMRGLSYRNYLSLRMNEMGNGGSRPKQKEEEIGAISGTGEEESGRDIWEEWKVVKEEAWGTGDWLKRKEGILSTNNMMQMELSF
jgi:hypothetical protein